MNSTALFVVGSTMILIGTLLVRYCSGRIVGRRASFGESFLVSSISLLSSFAAMVGFSKFALDSSFFALLPFFVQFVCAGITTKLFVWKGTGENGDGIPESFLLAFVLVIGIILGMLIVFLVGIIGASFARTFA